MVLVGVASAEFVSVVQPCSLFPCLVSLLSLFDLFVPRPTVPLCSNFRFIPKITAAMPNGFMPGKKRNKSGGGGTGGSTSGGNGTAVA